MTDADKGAVVQELASGEGRSLLFTRTKHGAKKLAKQLTQAGVPAVDLHGNLAQNARDRNLAAFRSGEVRVLVATDIAARGIHVDDVNLVVHVDPPAEHKAYTHRSGRTARAGAAGVVVTVATHAQRSDVATLARKAGIKPTAARVRPGAPDILALTGPRAAYVTPSAAPAQDDQKRPQRGGGGRSRPVAVPRPLVVELVVVALVRLVVVRLVVARPGARAPRARRPARPARSRRSAPAPVAAPASPARTKARRARARRAFVVRGSVGVVVAGVVVTAVVVARVLVGLRGDLLVHLDHVDAAHRRDELLELRRAGARRAGSRAGRPRGRP